MKNIRIDSNGELRCWNCGSKGLLAKRTARSKVAFGVGALASNKKLKCQSCGEYNDTGTAQPFTGPASRKWRKQYEAEQGSLGAARLPRPPPPRSSPEQAPTLPPPPTAPPAVPAGWRPDPTGRNQLRYWDGYAWSAHVASGGVRSVDPVT